MGDHDPNEPDPEVFETSTAGEYVYDYDENVAKAGVTMQRSLHLAGYDPTSESSRYGKGHRYSFALGSFGLTGYRKWVEPECPPYKVTCREPTEDEVPSEEVSPTRIFNSKHRMEVDSDYVDRLNPDEVHIADSKGTTHLAPASNYAWRTDEDLSSVLDGTSDANDNEEIALGGMALALSIAPVAPYISGGIAATMSGTGIGLSAVSLVGALIDREGGEEETTEDGKWIKKRKTTAGWGPLSEIKDVTSFGHTAVLEIHVPEGEEEKDMNVTDSVRTASSNPEGYKVDPLIDEVEDNEEVTFKVELPDNEGRRDADEMDLPEINLI
jgi:hypothetical protein